MNKVIKRDGTFELSPDPSQLELSAARQQHAVELELLSIGKADSGAIAVILCHLLLRIKALESQIR